MESNVSFYGTKYRLWSIECFAPMLSFKASFRYNNNIHLNYVRVILYEPIMFCPFEVTSSEVNLNLFQATIQAYRIRIIIQRLLYLLTEKYSIASSLLEIFDSSSRFTTGSHP